MHKVEIRKTWISTGIIAVVIIVLHYFFSDATFTEYNYSQDWYVSISSGLRGISGALPFPVGDFLYAGFVLLWVVTAIDVIRAIIKKDLRMQDFWMETAYNIRKLVSIVLVFYLMWGFNYKRLGIAHQLELTPQSYTTGELDTLVTDLQKKVNATRQRMGDSVEYPRYEFMFTHVAEAYDELAQQNPIFTYDNPAIKKSFYGRLGNFMGFTGYYNPFSGEANVNIRIPKFLIPFTAAHEVAHQLGYASEDEASFVAYLAAKSGQDTILKYSTFFELFNYANGELRTRDTALARKHYEGLDTLVKADIKTYADYVARNKSFARSGSNFLYGIYLKANNQPAGIESYNQVTSLLIAYKRKFKNL